MPEVETKEPACKCLTTKKEKIPIDSNQNDYAFMYYPKNWTLWKNFL